MSIKSYFLSKISKDSSEENTGASDSKKQPEAKGAGTSGKKRKAPDADTETKTANVAGKIQHPLPSVVYHNAADWESAQQSAGKSSFPEIFTPYCIWSSCQRVLH